ncbi:MAG: hypothetical protein ABI411_15215 [Tahibacter sp.]
MDAPILVPTNPVQGQTVSVSIRSGICDGFYDDEPGYPQNTRTGNAIRILLASVHEEDQLFCNIPDFTSIFSVGTFPAGVYTVQVDRVYTTSEPFDFTETLATLPLVIAGGSTSVPTIGPIGLGLMVVGLIALSGVALRRRGKALMLFAVTSLAHY